MKRRTLRRLVATGALLGTMGIVGVADALPAAGPTAHDYAVCTHLQDVQANHGANTSAAQAIFC